MILYVVIYVIYCHNIVSIADISLICSFLNAEHGETEGDESAEAEENVSSLFLN